MAAGACSYLLGQNALLRVGLLLALLPPVCAAVLHRTRHRVASGRRLTPRRVPVGGEARVHLDVENVSRLPTGLLMLEDRVPYVLGPRPRFVLDRVEAGGRREVSYRVRSDLRGRYPLGPLRLRLTDPFGMCELTRAFSPPDELLVVPRVEPLPPVRFGGEARGYGDGRRGAPALTGEDDVIPRGYRHGDDLRRVHWRSTARHGELMVRREEQPRRARCTVLLDTRAAAHSGSGPSSAFEWAVSGAASVVAHMLERGFSVRLVTDTGRTTPGAEGGEGFGGIGQESAESAGALMDALAVVERSRERDLSPAYDVLRDGSAGLLVAFLGDLDEEQTLVVAAMRRHGGEALCLLLEREEWATAGTEGPTRPEAERDARERTLREAGWTVVRVARGSSLEAAWRQADRERRGGVTAGGGAGAW